MKTKTILGYMDLDYVVLVNIPVRQTKEFGEIIDISETEVERRVCEELIRQRAPLRGREILTLRKGLSLSLEKMGAKLEISGTTIQRWEKEKDKRQEHFTEAALRSFFAEEYKVDIRGWYRELTPSHNVEAVTIKFAA